MKDVLKGVAVKIISIVVIIAILCTGGFVVYKRVTDKMRVEHNRVSNVEIVKEKLEAASELNTGSYLCTVVSNEKDSKEFKGWKIPLTEKSFIIQYDGVVKAGIMELTKAKISEKGNTIIVKLPAVEITSVELDNNSFEILDQKNNVFNPINVGDTNEAQKNMKEKMKEQAVERGLLDIAKDNAEDLLVGILKSSNGGYEIKIEWQ